MVGPPDRKCCQVLEVAEDTQQQQQGVIHQCLRLFTSDAFFLLLSNLTGLRLHQLAPEDEGGGGSEAGGQTVYIARGEDEELVTVAPGENTLSLVYRDKDSLKFIKCVNSRLQGHFHDLSLTYYE